MTNKEFHADLAWLPQGWADGVRIGIDGGWLGSVAEGAERGSAEYLGRYVLPGMPNLHSHAFQRAMAGLAERSIPARLHSREGQEAAILGRTSQEARENFWSWRETMYTFAGCVGPDELRAIAAQLYVEMLKSGYTHVCEFHYLHHQPDGRSFADPAAMSLALIEAAREAGIGLTLLPVLYMSGGFDGRPLSDRQRRFGFEVDGYLRLMEQLRKMESSTLRVGVALHSLRAVPEDAMRVVLESEASIHGVSSSRHPVSSSAAARDAIQGIASARQLRPIHIHIAEQLGEVQDCLALRNARPVEWLLDHATVDASWCLVHATHMTADETLRLAQTGAVAGLCPTTEANLGDGLFPLKGYRDAGGILGIGSDSHISVSPVEELRWLEYGQRLITHHRNIAVSESSDSVGENLWGDALFGGAQASGVEIGAIENGARADFIVLDDTAPLLAARSADNLLDTFLFAGNANLVRHVMVNGAWVVRDFRHKDEERIAARYREVVEKLSVSQKSDA